MKQLLISSSICLVIGAIVGAIIAKRFIAPVIITKTEIKEVIKTDIQTKERIVKQKDGTEIIERVITDKSIATSDKSYIITEQTKKLWNISLFSGMSLDNNNMIYGINVQKKYLGDISLGMFATTSKEVGVSIGYSF